MAFGDINKNSGSNSFGTRKSIVIDVGTGLDPGVPIINPIKNRQDPVPTQKCYKLLTFVLFLPASPTFVSNPATGGMKATIDLNCGGDLSHLKKDCICSGTPPTRLPNGWGYQFENVPDTDCLKLTAEYSNLECQPCSRNDPCVSIHIPNWIHPWPILPINVEIHAGPGVPINAAFVQNAYKDIANHFLSDAIAAARRAGKLNECACEI